MKTANSATYNGQTYTRTGRKYSHLVITTSTHAPRPLISWASTLELAQRNADQIAGRRDRARNGTLKGGWCPKYHAGITDIAIVPVTHGGPVAGICDRAARRPQGQLALRNIPSRPT